MPSPKGFPSDLSLKEKALKLRGPESGGRFSHFPAEWTSKFNYSFFW